MSVASSKYTASAIQFQIPDKLYGRETQLEALMDSFLQVIQGKTDIVVIQGYSGTGKSSLVRGFEKRLEFEDLSSYIAKGKCDKLQNNIPYYPIIQAFEGVISEILTSASKIEQLVWEKAILKAIGNTGRVLTDIIPSLVELIGEQPPLPQVNGREATHRFNYAFEQLISVFATRSHPLILFIDDLQWIDRASLALLKTLLLDNQVQYLMMIGAVRAEEESHSDELETVIQDINTFRKKERKRPIARLSVKNLDEHQVNELVADSLKISPRETTEIAELIHQKTAGNPLFSQQLLLKLYNESYITYDNYRLIWFWDINEIEHVHLAEDVIALMIENLQQLPVTTRESLKMASCIGRQFNLKTVEIINQRLNTDVYDTAFNATYNHLEKAVQEGFLKKKGTNYVFSHDRIQQAVNSQNSAVFKRKVHLNIGRLLYNKLKRELGENFHQQLEKQPSETIFTILNHWNKGINIINSKVEKSELANLNLIAAQKSIRISAIEAALEYIESGIQLLYDDSWRRDYQLTLNLYSHLLETKYLSGDLSHLEERLIYINKHVKEKIDSVDAHEIVIQAYNAHQQFDKAFALGLKYLEELDFKLPSQVSKLNNIVYLTQLEILMRSKGIEGFSKLPKLTDQRAAGIMRILKSICNSIYFTKSDLLPVFTLKSIQVVAKYGNTPDAIISYGSYALICSGVLKKYQKAFEWGEFMSKLVEEYKAAAHQPFTDIVRYSLLFHPNKSIKEVLSPVHQSYLKCLETGNTDYTFYVAFTSTYMNFFAGQPLSYVLDLIDVYVHKLKPLEQQVTFHHLETYAKMYRELHYTSNQNRKKNQFNAGIRSQTESKNTDVLSFGIHCNQMIYNFYINDYQKAYYHANETEHYLHSSLGSYVLRMYSYFSALTFIQVLKHKAAFNIDEKILRKKIKTITGYFQKWSQQVPANYRHKYVLLNAEMKCLENEFKYATVLFDEAIMLTKKEQLPNEIGLARKMAAQFYLSRGDEENAKWNLEKAIEAFQKWEAHGLVEQLKLQYADLLKD